MLITTNWRVQSHAQVRLSCFKEGKARVSSRLANFSFAAISSFALLYGVSTPPSNVVERRDAVVD
jgi:hypothetical protein